MANELTGNAVQDTYGDLAHLDNSGAGVASTTTPLQLYDGLGNAVPLALNNQTLGASSGDQVAVEIAYTVNKTADEGNGLLISMTDISSDAASGPLSVEVDGVKKFQCDKSGIVYATAYEPLDDRFQIGSAAMKVKSAFQYIWSSTSTFGGTPDVSLWRHDDGTTKYLAIGDGSGTSASDITNPLIAGYLSALERSTNPAAPTEGQMIIWMSDGTGHGDDGDIMCASMAGGTANYGTLFDHSAGAAY